MLVDLCERIWLVVRVGVVISDDDARETLRAIVLAACDRVRVRDLMDVCDAKGRWTIRRLARHNNRRSTHPLRVEDGSDFIITIGVFILNDNHLSGSGAFVSSVESLKMYEMCSTGLFNDATC
jgi:hypothetical protein